MISEYIPYGFDMISREDYIFTIGYEGSTAVVDGAARRQYGKLSTMQLAEQGLFRAAFSSALYAKDGNEMRAFIAFYNAKTGGSWTEGSQLARLFGVNPESVSKVMVV